MDAKRFKETFHNCMVGCGFVKKGPYYYVNAEEIICVVGLQRSSFSPGYFINIGYIIRQLHPGLDSPSYTAGDLRGRFYRTAALKTTDFFDLEAMSSEEEFSKQIDENVATHVTGYLSLGGLRNLIRQNPAMLYSLTIDAKRLLGFLEC